MIKVLFDIINIMPIAVLMLMFFGRYTTMPQDSILGYTVSLCSCLLMIILRNVHKKNRFRLIGIITAFCVGLVLVADEVRRNLFSAEYKWLGWVVGISATAFVVGILTENRIWSRRILALIMLATCVVGMIFKWEISKAVFVLMLFVICLYLATEIQNKWKKEGYSDVKEHITRISPILLVLCIAVYFLPAPSEPYDWQFAKDVYNNAAVYLNRLFTIITHPSEEYTNIGFSESGEFFDNLKYSDQQVLIVSDSTGEINSIRLIGCISGEYVGDKWIFDTENGSGDRMMDTLETVCAIRKYNEMEQLDYIRKTNLQYENLLSNTKYIFAPAKIQVEASAEGNPDRV